jgi:hypothetical protein
MSIVPRSSAQMKQVIDSETAPSGVALGLGVNAGEKMHRLAGQAQQIAGMIDPLGSALLGELVVFAQEGRQLERLEMMGEQQLRRIAHDAAPASRSR